MGMKVMEGDEARDRALALYDQVEFDLRRLDEWTEFLYQQHLYRIGERPRVQEQERIRKGVRTLAARFIDGDEGAWGEILRLYGRQRQGRRASSEAASDSTASDAGLRFEGREGNGVVYAYDRAPVLDGKPSSAILCIPSKEKLQEDMKRKGSEPRTE